MFAGLSDVCTDNMSSKSLNDLASLPSPQAVNVNISPRRKRQRAFSGIHGKGIREHLVDQDIMEGNLDDRIEEVTDEISDLSAEMALLRQSRNDTSKQIEILGAIVIKQSKTINQLHKRIVNEEKRSMQQNILVHNIKEASGENTDEKVISFLKEKGITDPIIRIDISHRIGAERKPGSNPRPIVVRMESRKAAEHVLKQTKPAKGAAWVKIDPYVTPHVPEEIREQRRKLYALADMYRKKNEKASISIKNDHIVVNQQKITNSIVPPAVQDILSRETQKQLLTKDIDILVSNEIQERGSKFTLYTAEVSSPSDVRNAYLKVSSLPKCAAATHLISAHRLKDENHSWHDDGDFGLGRFIYKLMCDQNISNRAFFLSREFGGVHIGQRRFDITMQLITEIMISGKKVVSTPQTPTASSTPWSSHKTRYTERKFVSATKRLPASLAPMDSTGSSIQDSESSDKECIASEDDVNKTLTPGKLTTNVKPPK